MHFVKAYEKMAVKSSVFLSAWINSNKIYSREWKVLELYDAIEFGKKFIIQGNKKKGYSKVSSTWNVIVSLFQICQNCHSSLVRCSNHYPCWLVKVFILKCVNDAFIQQRSLQIDGSYRTKRQFHDLNITIMEGYFLNNSSRELKITQYLDETRK